MIIKNESHLYELEQGNRFIGEEPQLENSSIIFKGQNNILICEHSVKLVNSTISFNGNNSIVYLCQNKHNYYLSVSLNNDNVLYMGKNNYINGTLNIILSEQKHCLIGNDCLISFGIWIRTADPHLIYSAKSMSRINPSKSVYIGDHVWIGQSAMILKGSQIDSGSIIGAMSLVAGKKIPNNESWGGNPCKKIAESIFWDGACVHGWIEKDTQRSLEFGEYSKRKKLLPEVYLFEYDSKKCISYEEIDEKFSVKELDKKIEYLDNISDYENKNRFVHFSKSNKKSFFTW